VNWPTATRSVACRLLDEDRHLIGSRAVDDAGLIDPVSWSVPDDLMMRVPINEAFGTVAWALGAERHIK
jgi:hypothetical protein